jgi:hypothetical protein
LVAGQYSMESNSAPKRLDANGEVIARSHRNHRGEHILDVLRRIGAPALPEKTIE